MEKFAVDLEKVLDEFEFSEEREERVAVSVITNQSLPYICHVSQHRPPINTYRRPSFEPINLADADFAASPPHILRQQSNNSSLSPDKQETNATVSTQSIINKGFKDKQPVTDSRVIRNGFNGSSTIQAIVPPVETTDDNRTVSPLGSSRESGSSSEDDDDGETSSLSDEKPDLLDCNLVKKSINDYRQINFISSKSNNSNSRDESCKFNNDIAQDADVDDDNDGYGVSRHILPDVTTSTTLPLCLKLSSLQQDSINVNSNCKNINFNNSNSKVDNVFDLISSNAHKSNCVTNNDNVDINCGSVLNESKDNTSNDVIETNDNDDDIRSIACQNNDLEYFQNQCKNQEDVVVIDCNDVNVSIVLQNDIENDYIDVDDDEEEEEEEDEDAMQCDLNSENIADIEKSSEDEVSCETDVVSEKTKFDNTDKVVISNNLATNDIEEKSLKLDNEKPAEDHLKLTHQPELGETLNKPTAIGFTLDDAFKHANDINDEKDELEKYLEEFEKQNNFNFDDVTSTGDTLNENVSAVVDDSAVISDVEFRTEVDNCDKLKTFTGNCTVTDSAVEKDVKVDATRKSNDEVSVVLKSQILSDNEYNELKNIVENQNGGSLQTEDITKNATKNDVNIVNGLKVQTDESNQSACESYSDSHSEKFNKNLFKDEGDTLTIVKPAVCLDEVCENHTYNESQSSLSIMGNSPDKVTLSNSSDGGVCNNESNGVCIRNNEAEVVSRDQCESTSITCDAPCAIVQRQQIKENIENSNDSRITRPNFLELPTKITVNTESSVINNDASVITPSTSASPSSATTITSAEGVETCTNNDVNGGNSSPLSCDLSLTEDCQLGKVPPFWIPDADALTCMQCQQKFTFVRRRHHCRACGQVLCSKCCSMRSKLAFIEGEARVCQPCYSVIGKAASPDEGKSPLGRQPNPNNPMEYCSTIPPLQQAAGSLHQPPPSVLVPVGVLKREGRVKSEVAKQVMFSDGIRPGGDLTELDGSGEPRLPFRRPGRLTKRVGTPPGGTVNASSERIAVVGNGSRALSSSLDGGNRRPLDPITHSFIPSTESSDNKSGLPPIVERVQGEVVYSQFDEVAINTVKSSDQENLPVKFAVNRNLFVLVKRVVLDCCVNRECWCITSSGLACVGQDEIIFILECMPDEAAPPKDVFLLINMLYIEASKGNTVSELSFTPSFSSDLLDSRNHGGFLYIRPSYQCTSKLILPNPPFLVALLIHKWETPWARLFPIRLVLRLGAEYRYYPCPLVSIRHRQPLYTDIGHTIINILADFRTYSYTLPTVRGLVVHMEDRQTTILLPRNRYDQVVRALNNSNDSVLAFGANLSLAADSHLVCMQSSDDENTYHTQAINIHNKPRRVTGASFVVFNGGLKASSGLSGKSSIVEDGLMVQVPGDTMTALRTALRDMKDYSIRCGPHAEETVLLRWTADDANFNIGVKSCIDGRPMDGVPSMRVHNGTDYSGQYRIIRWTEVFILQCEEESSGDPLDISRLSESLASATCIALVPYLDLLAAANLTTIAIRAVIHPDHVGYEAGSNSEKLPPLYMNSLDNELVAVVHQAAVTCRDTPATLELLFRVMET